MSRQDEFGLRGSPDLAMATAPAVFARESASQRQNPLRRKGVVLATRSRFREFTFRPGHRTPRHGWHAELDGARKRNSLRPPASSIVEVVPGSSSRRTRPAACHGQLRVAHARRRVYENGRAKQFEPDMTADAGSGGALAQLAQVRVGFLQHPGIGRACAEPLPVGGESPDDRRTGTGPRRRAAPARRRSPPS